MQPFLFVNLVNLVVRVTENLLLGQNVFINYEKIVEIMQRRKQNNTRSTWISNFNFSIKT